MSANSNPIRRCAVYTRKSSEEGLEQDFNSLHAQREACEAYIRSQAGEGWRLVRTAYDDGGISGGTMERPALQCLLADIKQGLIDIVVVYKVDRLTRSLMDFSKIVEQLDRYGASFVAVTQQFNTSTSMGRLTLNVLLSFAQFEREVTTERIRDKVAASKRKGMWMGGNLPLGYEVENRKLLINKEEAKTVRLIYERYLELGSVRLLQEDLDRRKIRSKIRVSKEGQRSGGRPFSRGALYTLLANPIYVGDIRHGQARYDGLHVAILDRPLWDAVQEQLAKQDNGRKGKVRKTTSSPLTGKLFDESGERFTPSHTVKRGRRYRYYVLHRLVTGPTTETKPGWRLPAAELERIIATEMIKILQAPATVTDVVKKLGLDRERVPILMMRLKAHASRLKSDDTRGDALTAVLERATIGPDQIEIKLSMRDLTGEDEIPDMGRPRVVTCKMPLSLKRRGVATKLIIGGIEQPIGKPNAALVKIISRAHRWWQAITSGASSLADIIEKEKLSDRYVSKILESAFLAPAIVEQIVKGRQPSRLNWQRLMERPALHLSWRGQVGDFSGASVD
jgi:site-specific DNA recombinase